jgi:hypothetical protein
VELEVIKDSVNKQDIGKASIGDQICVKEKVE